MSFILDALKKIEQDKRRSDGAQIESIAVSRARFGRPQHLWSMLGIALVSAVVTAIAVAFLLNDNNDNNNPQAPEAAAPLPPKLESPIIVATTDLPLESRTPAPEPEPEPEPEKQPDPPTIEAPPNTSQPIRLVGRERVLLDALHIEDSTDTPDNDDPEPLPSDFPNLVLQGTSIIGRNAVAVISDQRVFEGDRIEGALVIKIGEREVELELDGRRFTLRL
jgi:hypothetical protein